MLIFLKLHLYFLAVIYFMIFWLIFIIAVKKGRKEILLISTCGAIMGPIVSTMHTTDWWKPNFIFNSVIKIEDVLFGFFVAGISSALYIFLKSKSNANKRHLNSYQKLSITLSLIAILYGCFYILKVGSFWASIITLTCVVLIAIYKDEKYKKPIFLVGLILLLIAIPGYLLGVFLNPNWIQQEWLISMLSGITILKIPVEEFIWFFFAGMGISASQQIFFTRK